MKHSLLALIMLLPFLIGCGNEFSPLSPPLDQEIDNQNGKIDDMQNVQNGLLAEIGKLKSELQIAAEKIENLQQGLINKNNENYGVQLFQGDGGLVLAFGLGVIAIFAIYYYKTRSDRQTKIAEMLAKQMATYKDDALEDRIFLAAMNEKVEEDVYKLWKKYQKN